MKSYSNSEMREYFGSIYSENTTGIEGHRLIDSGHSGPDIGITVMTHGDEPAGLGAMKYFMEEYDLASKLVKGRVHFVVNNLEAARKYFKITENPDCSNELKKECRYLDVNMNRLPDDLSAGASGYEIQRTRDLLEVYREFDYGADIHSTITSRSTMLLTVGCTPQSIISGVNADIVLDNMLSVQIGTPVIGFYGGENFEGYGYEAGVHEDPQAINNSIYAIGRTLKHYGFIEDNNFDINNDKVVNRFKILDSLVVPDSSYRLSRVFIPFEHILQGDLLAVSSEGKPSVLAKEDFIVLFPIEGEEIHDCTEEVMFMVEKVIS